ncbi:MAG TPA: histidine phosphatase family protein [Frankiaceae bacterium]|nr:histidine phosphatase family protein [Frankiaceae bacterium]
MSSDAAGTTPDQKVWLIRHGPTESSESGQHTGSTDVPLTDKGEAAAKALGPILARQSFARVISSPMTRARRTADLAGVSVDDLDGDLCEWNYGDYEGRTTPDIRETVPGWTVWRDGCPNGEIAGEVGARVDRAIERIQQVDGDVAVFAHGHVLRVLAARWLGESPECGRHYALSTAAVCVLGHERESPMILRWNDTHHLEDLG